MPLQKSFSEQNGSLKVSEHMPYTDKHPILHCSVYCSVSALEPVLLIVMDTRLQTRQRWHKSKSHSGIGQPSAATTTTRNTRSRPLERVADATKQKLNAFNFCPPGPEPEPGEPVKRALIDENENGNGNKNENDVVKPDAVSSLPPNLPLDAMKHLSTPVSRLAWRDLIGDSDVKAEDEDISPQEKIGWDTKQKPMYGLSPMPRKRGSKRARSSSPVSSPAACAKPMAPTVNVKQLSAALKSPCADPTIELWDRFSLAGSTATTPLGHTNPALAQIMVSSSPQPSKSAGTGRGEAGLRRTISCGANWPKRRRVERAETMPSTSVAVGESPSNNSKSSMVNALLKSVTGELSRSKAAQTQLDVLKSPSPRKRRYNPADHLSGSPKRRSSPTKSTPSQALAAANVSKAAGAAEDLSDYGDDDFDDDTLMSLDVDITPSLEPKSQATQPQTPVTKQMAKPNITIQGADTLLDEFADLDDDLFADAEDLLSQIDSACNTSRHTTASQAPISVSAASPGPAPDESAEDMYGDDFGGDFDFEAAEMAATQSSKQSTGSVPFVCKS